MVSRTHVVSGLTLALLLSSAVPGHGASVIPFKKKKQVAVGKKLTPAQSALIDKAVLREKEVIKVVRERAPIVETYIQNMKPDPVMRQVPESDQHFLGRVQFDRTTVGDDQYKAGPKAAEKGSKLGFFKNSVGFLGGLTGALHLQFTPGGFTSMLLMDPRNFDKQHYNFYFVRNDFLGNTPTAVFDVVANEKEKAPFFGRIWVETRDGNVVRFNGDFAGSEKDYSEFYHFDSWRTNVQPNLWLPTSFYVEESDPKSLTSTLRFKAINHIWGYVLKVPRPRRRTRRLKWWARRMSHRMPRTRVRWARSVRSPSRPRITSSSVYSRRACSMPQASSTRR